jgi:hypothetical protein
MAIDAEGAARVETGIDLLAGRTALQKGSNDLDKAID